MQDQTITTQLVNDLRKVKTPRTPMATHSTGFKYFRNCKVPMLKKTPLRFGSEHLNDLENVSVKVPWSDEAKVKLLGVSSCHVWR